MKGDIMSDDREMREKAKEFYKTQPTIYRATSATEHAEAILSVMVAFAAAERDAETEHCVKLLENSVDSVHTAHHSRDYCDGFLQGRKNLRETIVAAIRSRVAAKEKK